MPQWVAQQSSVPVKQKIVCLLREAKNYHSRMLFTGMFVNLRNDLLSQNPN